MQEIAVSIPTQEALEFIDHELKGCLTSSLTSMLGGASVAAEREKSDVYPPTAIWFSGGFTGQAVGTVHFALDPAEAASMGHKLLMAAGLEGESDATAVETLGEVFSQTTGGLASCFLARLKKDVAAQPLSRAATPATADHTLSYRLTTSDGAVLRLTAILDKSLIASLTLQPAEAPPKTAMIAAAAPSAGTSTRNLELLLDVELPVSVSFGRAQLQLKDVIKLTTGSIVELNRSVSEPVDIVVNNCVIARGEVVVVEGNFGVRIKQIVSKEDRLRSLG